MGDCSRPLTAFEYLAPGSLAEVLALLQENGARARLLAGGTDLVLEMKRRAAEPEILIDLNRVAELSFVELAGETLRIGASFHGSVGTRNVWHVTEEETRSSPKWFE